MGVFNYKVSWDSPKMQGIRQKVEFAAELLPRIPEDEPEDDHEGNQADAKHQYDSRGN